MLNIAVQREDFNLQDAVTALTKGRTDIGAVVSFIGLVRDMSAAQNLQHMTLEHYPGMTEKQLTDIGEQAMKRWPLTGATIIHRYGDLKPADQIVLVITTSAHREAAFEAASFLMDWLKTKAPFWKKEVTTDGTTTWVAAKDSDNQAANKWS